MKTLELCEYPQKILDYFFDKGFSINKKDYDFLMRTIVEIESKAITDYLGKLDLSKDKGG
jgi:hypothetical protein